MFKILIVDTLGETGRALEAMRFWKTDSFQLAGVVGDESSAHRLIKQNAASVVLLVSNGRDVREIPLLKSLCTQSDSFKTVLLSDKLDYPNLRAGFKLGLYDYLPLVPDENTLVECLRKICRIMGQDYFYSIYWRVSGKIDAIVDNIYLGGENVEFLCTDMIDYIYQYVNNDDVNANIIADETKEILYDTLIARKPWLEKFTNSSHYKKGVGFVARSKEQVIRDWSRDFTQVAAVVRKYQMLDNKLIYNIGKYVVVHVDEKLTLDVVSKAVFLNKSYISHIFKHVSGMSFFTFIADVKTDRACILLCDRKKNIGEIANMMNYSSMEYFSRSFKQKTGMTPSQYREQSDS